ncbi:MULTISPECIES: cbb3-type cytochrome c oxidase subunit 3 [unclassified Afifella]|uniref:cbb3-type cytochrome c oxidase subunit 3 n=1 Tax=Afifella TaxID=643217 RepID=UPI000FE3C43F
MSTYDTLRHFADKWGLLFMLLVFAAAVLWVYRPGARASYRAQGDIPFKHDERPAQEQPPRDQTPGRGE